MSKTLITKFTDAGNKSINIFELIMAVKFALMNLPTVTKDDLRDIYAQLSLLSRVANIFNWDSDEINDPRKRLEVSLESMEKKLDEIIEIFGERYRGQNKILVQKGSQVSMGIPLDYEQCNHLKIDGSIHTVRELAQHLVVMLNKLEAKQPGSEHQNSGEAGDPTGGKSSAKGKRKREDFTPAECLIDLKKSWDNFGVLLTRYGTSLSHQGDVGKLFQKLTEMSDWLKSNCDAGSSEIRQLDSFLKEYGKAQKMEDDPYESPDALKAWEEINQIAKRFSKMQSFDKTTKASTPKAGKKARQLRDDGQATEVTAVNDPFNDGKMASPLSLSSVSSRSSSPPMQDERLSKQNELIERLRENKFHLLEQLNSHVLLKLKKAIVAIREKNGPVRTIGENIAVDKIYRNNKFTNTSFSLLLSVVRVAYEELSESSKLSRRRWEVWVELDGVLCDRMPEFTKNDHNLTSDWDKIYDSESEARDVFSSDDYDVVSNFLNHVEKAQPGSTSFPHALSGGSSTAPSSSLSSCSSASFYRSSDAPNCNDCMDEDPAHDTNRLMLP